MRAVIDYRPDRAMLDIYMGSESFALTYGGGSFKVEQNEERPTFLSLNMEEYAAIRDAILERESPRLAEASLLKEMLLDTREVRDRLLTLVEED
jgi:hypothetical protein